MPSAGLPPAMAKIAQQLSVYVSSRHCRAILPMQTRCCTSCMHDQIEELWTKLCLITSIKLQMRSGLGPVKTKYCLPPLLSHFNCSTDPLSSKTGCKPSKPQYSPSLTKLRTSGTSSGLTVLPAKLVRAEEGFVAEERGLSLHCQQQNHARCQGLGLITMFLTTTAGAFCMQ